MTQCFHNASLAIADAATKLHDLGYVIHTEKWQSLDIRQSPSHAMIELLCHSFACRIEPCLDDLRYDVKPNLPWADDHFLERVGGKPLNPGEQYKNWPFYKHNAANDVHRVEGEQQFSHSYMERIWPKRANVAPGDQTHWGIRYRYGDLRDVVALLRREPLTRQAFLPIWFPEDTGAVEGQRVPCTIGYHFIFRGGYLNCIYYIRSCDFFRHFRDDIYLACRKVMWILDQLRAEFPGSGFDWGTVQPGRLTMHITSLHCFKQERPLLLKAR